MSRDSFQSRLESIGSRPSEPPSEAATTSEKAFRRLPFTILFELFMIATAFLCGLVSIIFAIWVRFHYLPTGSELGLSRDELILDIWLGDRLITTLVIAVVVSFILAEILNLKTLVRSGAELAGFLFGLFGLDYLVELIPSVFASLFSVEWVLFVLNAMSAGSLT